jgi:hypothetical protein
MLIYLLHNKSEMAKVTLDALYLLLAHTRVAALKANWVLTKQNYNFISKAVFLKKTIRNPFDELYIFYDTLSFVIGNKVCVKI